MNNPFFIKRAEYVEVQVPAGNVKQTIYFPDLPNLRTSKIFGIEVFNSQTQSISYSGAPVQTIQAIRDSITVLYFEGGEFIQVPTISLMRIDLNRYFESIPMLAGQVIVWAKSYIYLTDTTNFPLYAGNNYVFNVYYSKNNI